MVCFNCNQEGHKSADCPKYGCYVCGAGDHKARYCPNRGDRKPPVTTQQAGGVNVKPEVSNIEVGSIPFQVFDFLRGDKGN